ncbi:MAG: hypothetical protein GW867_07555 [Armatimonadetes bacterium]|nr:hypothetical protein [Armatimonadota bacterium]
MAVNRNRVRELLRAFDFSTLFTEELGWEHYAAVHEVNVGEHKFALEAVAEKRGMVVFTCRSAGCQPANLPDYNLRKRLDREVAKLHHEHVLIFVDEAQTVQVWQWVRREAGKPAAFREHRYDSTQSGEALIQKLDSLVFALEEEEQLTLFDVTSRTRSGFDVDRVTRRFYDRFKAEHAAFLKFLKGIPDEEHQRWYASVMLNRLMFIYFIQKKGFLDGDEGYLRHRLNTSKQQGKDRYFRGFLSPLFFEGFAKKADQRSAQTNQLLGSVPYLNGGLFQPHEIEKAHGDDIQIADAAFERLYGFFEEWHWHLDDRPLHNDKEINPDVLGYIFEKYINQKQMGAYYTKEDITEYISKNTVIPFLLDAARERCKVAFDGGSHRSDRSDQSDQSDANSTVWRLLADNPDRYLYDAVKLGVVDGRGNVLPESALPDFVQRGMHDPKERMFDRRYNLTEANLCDDAGNRLTLPTETWREYVERRKRCLELRGKLVAGEVREVNDLITYNLNLRQFAQDVIENCEGPDLLQAVWKAVQSVTVLDPTCGSGAFLFAALNILEALYEACLDRMEAFLREWGDEGRKRHPNYHKGFTAVLDRVADHPSRRYFIFKSIMVNNLYGVDLMDEAVEICKLRLFLKLVAQVDTADRIEPLPDIDFNIRAGNTLVGYATYQDVEKAVTGFAPANAKGDEHGKFDFDDAMGKIEAKAEDVEAHFALFRDQQTELGGEVTPADKEQLRQSLKELDDELNRYLATEYGVAVPPAPTGQHDSPGKLSLTAANRPSSRRDGRRVAQVFKPGDQDTANHHQVLKGRLNAKRSDDQSSLRDSDEVAAAEDPGMNALGYCQASLQDGKDGAYANWLTSHKPFHWFVEFHQIMKAGGFDVVIGNPPYVEAHKVRGYWALGFQTGQCGNLYALCVERGAILLAAHGRFGMIVPLSGFSTARMDAYQDLVWGSGRHLHISFFSGDAHPSVLFEGVNYRLCIVIASPRGAGAHLTAYTRWYASERPFLFPRLNYAQSDFREGFLRFAKLGSAEASRVLAKMRSAGGPLGSRVLPGGSGHRINYHRSPVFWIRSMDFEPHFSSATKARSTDHLKDLWFASEVDAKRCGAILNSTLFYFWFTVQGNCRNVAGPDIDAFPIGDMDMPALAPAEAVFGRLMADLKHHSRTRVYNYAHSGRVEYQEFYPDRSKPILDQIDCLLAEHYGFTDEELDFIINYDLKYRMGRGGGEDE